MNSDCNNSTTPGGRSTRTQHRSATKLTDSGELGQSLQRGSELSKKPSPFTYIGTFNIQTLIQTGKLHQLTTELHNQKIKILALQETRFTDNNPIDMNGFTIFKSPTKEKYGKNCTICGMGFAVRNTILSSVIDIKPISNRLMTLRMKNKNKKYTIVNAHAPTNGEHKKNPEKVETYWALLEKTLSNIPKEDVVILLGDFNAQIGHEKKYRKTVGNFPAHKFTNKNGMKLVETCQQFNLKLKSTSLRKRPNQLKTWRCPNTLLGEYQIDHVAISYNLQKEIHNIQVRKGAGIDSDHYLLRVKILMTPKKRQFHQTQPPIPKFDLTKIKHENLTEIWDQKPANNWNDFKTKIIENAKLKIPLKKRPKHPWWNYDCERAFDLKKLAAQKYLAQKTEINQNNYHQVRKNANRTIRQTKRNYIKTQLESIDTDFHNYNARGFFRTFTNYTRAYDAQNLFFRKPDGKLALTPEENCEELARYFKTLLNCPEPTERFPKITNPQNTSSPPTTQEIDHHIAKLKNNKASGEDGIVAEMLKNLGPKSKQEIYNLIAEIWETEAIPDEWKTAIIHPLHKKGDKSDVNNYRGISLLPVTYKILSSCLLKRTQEQIEPKLAEYQAGFRPARSCPEQIHNLKSIINYCKQRNRKLVCMFVDFKKAYDSIDRQSLFQILEEYGLDNKTLNLIRQTLTDTKSKVKFRGRISRPFQILTGVRQGDGLSPLLFNLTLDKVMKEWEHNLKNQNQWDPVYIGTKNNKIEIPYLAFADDLAILTDSIESATHKLQTLHECAQKVGLQISYAKTEFITAKIENPKITTQYGEIYKVGSFKYLGELIQINHDEKETTGIRWAKLRKSLGMINNIYNKKSISKNAKIRHYNAVIKSTVLYGSETLSLGTMGHEKLKLEERRILRRILGPIKTEEGYRLRPNKEIEEHSNLEVDIRKRRLKFYGHIKRMNETRLTKKILDKLETYKTQSKWLKQTHQDLNALKITPNLLQDRTEFRNRIQNWQMELREKREPNRRIWTEEEKLSHSLRMKEWWANKKRSTSCKK